MRKATQTKRPLIRLDVDRELHARVRLAAARINLPMAEFARVAVAEKADKVNRKKD